MFLLLQLDQIMRITFLMEGTVCCILGIENLIEKLFGPMRSIIQSRVRMDIGKKKNHLKIMHLCKHPIDISAFKRYKSVYCTLLYFITLRSKPAI